MKDTIIKGTGDSRYLKSAIPENITHAQLVEMLRNGTFPIDLNGINEAGIEQLGTPLNTATLLSDETAEEIGIEKDNPTVDDALSKVRKHATEEVGDIKISTRTDVGDKYLLANGADVSTVNYPDLVGVVPKTIAKDDYDTHHISDTATSQRIYSSNVVEENGNLHMLVWNGSAYLWATRNKGQNEWTYQVTSGWDAGYEFVFGPNSNHYKLFYLNNQYVAISTSTVGYLSTEIPSWRSADGVAWEQKDLAFKGWSQSNISYGQKQFKDIAEAPNGKICAVFVRTSSTYYGSIAVADSIDGTLTTLDTTNYAFTASLSDATVSYADGYFIISFLESKYPMLSLYNIETGEWTEVRKRSSALSIDSNNYATKVLKTSNGYVTNFGDQLLYMPDLQTADNATLYEMSQFGADAYKGATKVLNILGDETYFGICFNVGAKEILSFMFDANSLTLIESAQSGATVIEGYREIVLNEDGYSIITVYGSSNSGGFTEYEIKNYAGVALPTISIDNAYAYIRAKE